MRPHLVRWDKSYRDQGLVIIDIDNGGIDTKEAVTEHIEEDDVPYRTIWDAEGALCETYGVRGFPAAFLLNVAGEVVWEGFPLPNVKKLEELMQTLLEDVPEDLRSDPEAPSEAPPPDEE